MTVQNSKKTTRRITIRPKKSAISQAMQAIKRNDDIVIYVDESLVVSVVTSENEKKECMQLAYREYLKKNYIEECEAEINGYEKMKTIYDDEGKSIIFKAEMHQKIIGTVTVNWDS